MQVRAVVCDFDKTIAANHSRVDDPEVGRLFQEFKRRGVVVGGNTGRNQEWTFGRNGIHNDDIRDALSFVISGSGGAINHPKYPRRRPWRGELLGPHYSRAVTWRLRTLGVPAKQIWANSTSIGIMNRNEPEMRRAIDDVNKVRTFFHLRRINICPVYNNDSAVWLPVGLNKGTALTHELKRHGIDLSQTVGCGDGQNDYDMLKLCGLALVPSDAHPSIKALPHAIVGTKPGHEGVKALLADLLAGRIAGWTVDGPGGLGGLQAA